MAKVKESKKLTLIRNPLPTDKFDELNRASKDPFFFSLFVWCIHPKRGKVKFALYPFQKAVLKSFLLNRFNIILKFRQAGITELIAMFCLWYAMYHKHKNIQIISIKERTAKRVLRRIKFMYENLPDHLKVPVVNGRGDDLGTSTEMEFANGSLITSIPTTEEAGRSEAASLLVIDEAAIVRWASIIWAAAFPTLSTGGRAIINSTPYGMGNFFHTMWVGANEPGKGWNKFIPVRLKWTMHPERYRFKGDFEWYNEQAQILGPRRTAQEIDGDFLTSGHSVFDLVEIRALEDEIRNIEWVKTYSLGGGELYVRYDPIPWEKYWIGGDVASGRGRDYSAFSIMNDTGKEYAFFKGKLSPSKFADLMARWGFKYNRAQLAPESNDIGLATTEKLQNDGYPNLYYSNRILRKKGESRNATEEIPGWYTTSKTRPIIISALEEDLRNKDIDLCNKFFVSEAYTFIYDQSNRPVAMGKDKKSKENEENMAEDKFTDDAIIETAITNYIRKSKKYGPVHPGK